MIHVVATLILIRIYCTSARTSAISNLVFISFFIRFALQMVHAIQEYKSWLTSTIIFKRMFNEYLVNESYDGIIIILMSLGFFFFLNILLIYIMAIDWLRALVDKHWSVISSISSRILSYNSNWTVYLKFLCNSTVCYCVVHLL